MAECSLDNCNEECFEDNDKCILHCEKDNEWEKKNDNNVMFQNKIQRYIQNSMKNDAYEFNYIIFPNINKKIDLFYNLNEGFTKDEFLDVKFHKCHFLGEINFISLRKGKEIIFNECHLLGEINFMNLKFENSFLFEGCIIECDIQFKNISFMKSVSFINSTFKNKIEFIHIKFHQQAFFNDIKIKNMKFENLFFSNESNFLNIRNELGNKLKSHNIFNRETARIIKNSFEQQNNIIEANKYYELEMKKREEELNSKEKNNWFERLIFNIHGIASNHSQDALLALFWIVIVGVFASYFSFYTMQDKIGNYVHFNILPFLGTMALSFSIIGCKYIFKKLEKMYYYFVLVFFPLLYYYTTNDSWFTLFSNTINPFSIMTKGETLNLGMLIFKVIIAYLIYQFVVSVRQNTRRK